MIKITDSKAELYLFYRNVRPMVLNRSKYGKTYLLPFKYSYSRYKKRKNQHVFNVFTPVGVKQLTDFLRTVTAASDLVDCTLVNCGFVRYNSPGDAREHMMSHALTKPTFLYMYALVNRQGQRKYF